MTALTSILVRGLVVVCSIISFSKCKSDTHLELETKALINRIENKSAQINRTSRKTGQTKDHFLYEVNPLKIERFNLYIELANTLLDALKQGNQFNTNDFELYPKKWIEKEKREPLALTAKTIWPKAMSTLVDSKKIAARRVAENIQELVTKKTRQKAYDPNSGLLDPIPLERDIKPVTIAVSTFIKMAQRDIDQWQSEIHRIIREAKQRREELSNSIQPVRDPWKIKFF